MENKFNMTKEDNIFFAKRKLIDNIYKSANLEGIAVTFADTYSFMNNVNTGNISIDDMLKLKGLKDAWEYVLNTIDEELTIDYIKKIHFQVCKGQNIFPLGDFKLLISISPSSVFKEIGFVVAMFSTSISPSSVERFKLFNRCFGTVIVIVGSPLMR